jgi:hypothetical protein
MLPLILLLSHPFFKMSQYRPPTVFLSVGAVYEGVNELERALFPCLHQCKEGWPSKP